jgi:Xaa-Pro dipeptidase
MASSLAFSRTEFDSRLDKFAAGLKARGLDAAIVNTPENIYYLTSYHTTTQAYFCSLVVTKEKSVSIVLPLLEEPIAKSGSTVDHITTYEGPQSHQDPIPFLAETLKKEGLKAKKIGFEMFTYKKGGGFLTVGEFEKLKKLMPGASFGDCYGIAESLRLIKSPAELKCVREAAKISCKAVGAGISAVKEGCNENDLAVAVWSGLIRNGSDPPASQPYVMAGPRTALIHASYEGNTMKRNQIAYFEVSAAVKRYHGPVLRCAYLGNVPEKVERVANVLEKSLMDGIDRIKPGLAPAKLDKLIRGNLAEHGYHYPHESGYSVGISFPQAWMEVWYPIRSSNNSPLKPNMTIHLVPIIPIPEVGSVGLSNTVLVTEDGHEVLTSDLESRLFRV